MARVNTKGAYVTVFGGHKCVSRLSDVGLPDIAQLYATPPRLRVVLSISA